MEVTFMRLIYPKKEPVQDGSYMVALYEPTKPLERKTGERLSTFRGVGYALPRVCNQTFDLHGHWDKTKYGLQYVVESYDEVIVPTKEGIVTYLSCGQIDGIGKTLAERIFEKFRAETLCILDNDPSRLLEIKGISKKRLERIKESYEANRGARDLIAFLAPYGVSPKKAVCIYREYGREALAVIRENPYKLCALAEISFLTADKLAEKMGFPIDYPDRLQEALLFMLSEAEKRGHLCMPRYELIAKTMTFLAEGRGAVPESYLRRQANELYLANRLHIFDEDMCFRTQPYDAEQEIAVRLATLMDVDPIELKFDFASEIRKEERKLKFRLDNGQKSAIKMALSNPVSIITGGPGTGKTSIQRAILDIFHRYNPDKKILCCAPTGRAARRMEEATSFAAFTIHSALQINPLDEDQEVLELNADLILVDEVSMVDVYVARYLFNSVRKGSQLILIGDADQLPSVGPGAVLSELLKSDRIPVHRLDRVHRQASGSRIAINAQLIRHGNIALETGPDFEIIESSGIVQSAALIERLYSDEVLKYGADQVALLTPLRKKTETGAVALNTRIQQIANPATLGKPEVKLRDRVFRVGDRVMQLKNNEYASNGDVGHITAITNGDRETSVMIDFGDGRNVCYDSSELGILDLGYACTIHKSQGGQYDSVIINIHDAHRIMLKRPLIYTAITRAKKHVILVGEVSAIYRAIETLDTEKRNTCLAERLRMWIK